MLNRTSVVGAGLCATLLIISGAAGSIEPLKRVQIISSAQIARPVLVTHAPGDYGRIFIVEQKPSAGQGRIRIYDLHEEELLSTPFLTVTGLATGGDEQGLLGLAFHPNYAENGYIFINYTASSGTIIRRYTVDANDPNVIDPTTRKTILTFNQPAGNHNGGWLDFGPDGYLYIATGDGGFGGDPSNHAQNLNSLLGKMLRIDVDVPVDTIQYLIPADNPFVGLSGLNEIWSYGLRNPWRSSFDRETGDLYIADVGQNAWEEVSFQHADSTGGENYGWKCYEGNANFQGNASTFCPGSPPLVWPFHVYSISGTVRCAIMGGYVYRGCNIPSMQGHYFFADHCGSTGSGNIWSMKYDRDNAPAPSSSPPASHPVSDFTNHSSVLGTARGFSSFGEDARGELYFTTMPAAFIPQGINGVHRIEPVTPTISPYDLNCDGVVDIFDLLDVLANWGDCFGCKQDVTGDGIVDIFDLLQVLANWG